MQRILHIVPTLMASWHTAQLRLLVAGLDRQGFESRVAVWSGPVGTVDGAPTAMLRARNDWDLSALRRLVRLIAEVQPDSVHLWGLEQSLVWQVAAWYAKAKHIIVSTGNASVSAFSRRRARYLDRMIVCNDATRIELASRGLPAAHVTGISAGVAVSAPARPREELFGELGIPGNAIVIGAAGGLLPSRGLKDLIWATDLLKFLRDDVHLLVFGEGPHRPRLERYCRQVRIEDKVHLLGERDDWQQWLPHLSAFWSARSDVAQPLAMLEAMAAGVPVVAADVRGVRDVITHEESGFLFPVGDRAAIARHTQRLLEDNAQARRIGEAGREVVQSRFRVDAMLARYAALYRELAHSA